MANFAVFDKVQYVGGSRVIAQSHTLRIGQQGIVHSIWPLKNLITCAFGSEQVLLSTQEVRKVSGNASGTGSRASSARIQKSTSVPKVKPGTHPSTPRAGQRHSLPFDQGAWLSSALEVLEVRRRASRTAPELPDLRLPDLTIIVQRQPARGDSSDSSADVSVELELPHPPSFYCPISRQCMHDPVVIADGHTYERRHIELWLKHKDTSPVSGAKLDHKEALRNHALRNAIEEYFEQVLLSRRQAIRSAMAALMRRQGKLSCDDGLLRTIDSLMQCAILVNADLSLELVLKKIMEEAKTLVGAEVASVFLVDRQQQQLFSTVNSTGKELRIHINSGVAGHVASSGSAVIIPDAYKDSRFNTAVDADTGFRTRNILCVPIRALKGGIIGVAQLINKTAGGVLTDPEGSHELMDFTLEDQEFFEILAAQAGAAIAASGMFDRPQAVRRRAGSPIRMNCKARRALAAEKAPELMNLSDSKIGLSVAELCLCKPMLNEAWSSWETDTLTLAELTGNKPLSVLAMYLFERHGLIHHFGMDRSKLERFMVEIENGYPVENLYHNRAHAASVLHFMHSLMLHGKIADLSLLAITGVQGCRPRMLVILAGLLAAVVHDFEHEGLSNDFLVKSQSEKAITYNDRSPNENHHTAAAFRVLQKEECNFLEALDAKEFRQLRSLIVYLVLGTDMAENARIVQALKDVTPTDGQPFTPASQAEAVLALKMALKVADVGHLALSWSLHLRWVRRLEQEFFLQGDKEKKLGLPKVSFLMDRSKPGVSQTQTGFFDFVINPMMRTFQTAFPDASPMTQAVEANGQRWRDVKADVEASA